MARSATVAASNWVCQARLKAAKYNQKFLTRVGAAEEIPGVTEDVIKKIELGISTPSNEVISLMADAYGQPEMADYYCANTCPLGKRCREIPEMPPERSVVRLHNSIEEIKTTVDRLSRILDDGIIDDEEKKEIPLIKADFLEMRRRFDEALVMLEKAEHKSNLY